MMAFRVVGLLMVVEAVGAALTVDTFACVVMVVVLLLFSHF